MAKVREKKRNFSFRLYNWPEKPYNGSFVLCNWYL